MLTSLDVWICHCWMEYEQRVIIRFLLNANANANNIHRRHQAQFTDDAYNVRSFRHWSLFIKQGQENFHDAPSRIARWSTLSAPKSCQHWRGSFHSAQSFAEVVGVCYSANICYLRDSLGIKAYMCVECHMSWLRICIVADLKSAGGRWQSWKQESSIYFGLMSHGTRVGLCHNTSIQQNGAWLDMRSQRGWDEPLVRERSYWQWFGESRVFTSLM
jgi:hypothetical protein